MNSAKKKRIVIYSRMGLSEREFKSLVRILGRTSDQRCKSYSAIKPELLEKLKIMTIRAVITSVTKGDGFDTELLSKEWKLMYRAVSMRRKAAKGADGETIEAPKQTIQINMVSAQSWFDAQKARHVPAPCQGGILKMITEMRSRAAGKPM